jgi:KEOPS complex subunit Cgi121
MNGICEIRAAIIESCHPEDLIRKAQIISIQSQCCIVCLDADRMAGRKHVESAVRHALRAWHNETAIADSLEMEVLLYAGGTRQTSIGRNFGVRSDTHKLYVCFIPFSDEAITEMGQWVQYIEDHEIELNEDRIRQLMDLFGISREEYETVGKDRIQELVIERVALLDVYK